MRLRFIALILGLAVLAQTGCKCCRSYDNAPPPPPYSIQVSPPPAGPIQVSPPPAGSIQSSPPPFAPAVGAMLPAADPDRAPVDLPLPQASPTTPTSFNRLTSWSR